MDWHTCRTSIFWQKCRGNSVEKRVFSTTSTGAIGSLHAKMMNFDPDAKTNSKQIVDLNVKSKMIKLLYENRRKYLWICVTQRFLSNNTKSTVYFLKMMNLTSYILKTLLWKTLWGEWKDEQLLGENTCGGNIW